VGGTECEGRVGSVGERAWGLGELAERWWWEVMRARGRWRATAACAAACAACAGAARQRKNENPSEPAHRKSASFASFAPALNPINLSHRVLSYRLLAWLARLLHCHHDCDRVRAIHGALSRRVGAARGRGAARGGAGLRSWYVRSLLSCTSTPARAHLGQISGRGV